MVQIKINGQLVDMFPDTKVSGNYSPVDFAGNEGFEVPYTDTFSIPMTERNASIIGFNKNESTFDNIKRRGQVYAEGELMFSGIVEIDEATYETLEEMISIRIIDVISYIFNDAKDKSISDIMDYQLFKGRSFIALKNLGLYPYTTTSGMGIGYVDQTGFSRGLLSDNLAGVPVYAYKGRDKGCLPFCFSVKETLSAIFNKYGLKLNESKLPYDIKDKDVVVSFPLTYMSSAKRSTSMSITTGYGVGYAYMPKHIDEASKNRFDDYKYLSIFYPSSNVFSENQESIFTDRKFGVFKPNGTKLEPDRKVPIIDTEFILRPKKIDISVLSNKTLFSIGDGNDINSYNVEKASCLDFYIYIYQIDGLGNRLGAYRIGEVTFSENLKSVVSVNITEDYLFSEKLKMEAGEKITLYQALIPKEPCKIYSKLSDSKESAKYEVDELVSDNSINQTVGYYSVRLNARIAVDYDILYGDEHTNHSEYQICTSFFTSPQLVDGTMYCSSTDANFKNSKLTLFNVRESLKATELNISDFLNDFCNRFNCKISSDGEYVFITKIDGDSDDILDISTRVNSPLIGSVSDKNANIRAIKVDNTAYNCFMDKYFDGRAFGSSDNVILDTTKKEDKIVTIKSAIMPNIMSGEKLKTQSANVTELYEHFKDLSYLGYCEYKDFNNSESGIRYSYINQQDGKKPILCLYPTFTYEGSGNSFGKGYADFIYQPSNAIVGETTITQEDGDLIGVDKGEMILYEYTGGKPTDGRQVGVLKYTIKDGAIAFTAIINGNYSDTFYRNGVTTGTFLNNHNISCVSGTGASFSYSSLQGFNVEPDVKFDIVNRFLRISSTYGKSFNGFGFTIKTIKSSASPSYNSNVRAVPFATGYDILYGMPTVPPREYASVLTNTSLNSDGTLSTLAYNKLGINKRGIDDSKIITAYDRYYKDYETSILSGKSTTIELDVYLDSLEARRILSGCRVKLYGKIYTVVSASEIDFSNNYGGIVNLKIAKLK